MTEPAATAVDAPAEPVEHGVGRGRPRPNDVIERDDRVFAALETPATRAELVARTGLGPNEIYLSLYRLKRDGRIARVRSETGKHTWVHAEFDTPVPNTSPAE